MGKFRFADEVEAHNLHDREMYEEISEAAALGIQKHPFEGMTDDFDNLSREELIAACVYFVYQRAELRVALHRIADDLDDELRFIE